MRYFHGIYYDGRSSSSYSASILISDKLEISVPSKSGLEKFNLEYYLIREISVGGGSKTILNWGEHPRQTLEIEDNDFFSLYIKAKGIKDPHSGFVNIGRKGILIGVTGILSVIGILYFLAIPVLMDLAAENFPKDMERSLGEKIDDSFINTYQIDSNKTIYINNFYNSLHFASKEVEIIVLKSSIKNAFALPGGKILVFEGILNDMKSEGELIGLLGHETGHIEKRHTLKLLFRSISNYLIISAILQDVSGLMAVVIDNASKINQLSYNREAETESDRFGYEMMIKNNINPIGMIDLFENLKKGNHSKLNIPQFFSTHPNIESRILQVKEWMGDKRYKNDIDTIRSYYFKKIKEGI